MKKVLAGLISISFLAVLLVPTVTLAVDNCPNWNCQDEVGIVPCMCGTDTKIADSSYYCWGGGNDGAGRAFSTQSACQNARSGGTTGGGVIDTPEKLVALIDRIGGYIFQVLLAVAGIFLIMAGFFFVTAGGNPENVTKARQMLVNALIGVAVAVVAQGLKTLVMNLVS